MNLNLETVTTKAFLRIRALDKFQIGTPDYMGVAWSHHYHYRYYLRDASTAKRRRAHKLLLAAGLDPSACCQEADRIVVAVACGRGPHPKALAYLDAHRPSEPRTTAKEKARRKKHDRDDRDHWKQEISAVWSEEERS